MEFIISLEDEFGLEIPDQDIENLYTFQKSFPIFSINKTFVKTDVFYIFKTKIC